MVTIVVLDILIGISWFFTIYPNFPKVTQLDYSYETIDA